MGRGVPARAATGEATSEAAIGEEGGLGSVLGLATDLGKLLA